MSPNVGFPVILRSPILMALGVALLIVAIKGNHIKLWNSFVELFQEAPIASPLSESPDALKPKQEVPEQEED